MKLGTIRKNIRQTLEKNRTIPKIIHQIWVGPNPIPFIWVNTWRFDYISNNPEWEYRLWTDDNIHTLKYLDTERYNQEKTWNGKSDFLRFSILKEFGGVYIDADSVCINSKSLDSLIKEAYGNFFAAWEDHEGAPKKTIAGGVCGSPIDHPVVNQIIQVQNQRWDKYHEKLQAWQTVGPLAVQEGVEKSKFKKCTIFPSKYFYPEWWHHYSQHFTTIDVSKFPDSYMYQFGYSTNGYGSCDAKNKLQDLDRFSKSCVTTNPDLNSEIIGDLIVVDRNNSIDVEKECNRFLNSNVKILDLGRNKFITHSLYIKEILKERGFTFVIRAKNEEKNVKMCLESLIPLVSPLVEIVFVDNGSTDNTYELAMEYSSKAKVFRYPYEIGKTGTTYKKTIENNPDKSIAKFYNWCVDKASKNIILKWDADFMINLDNFSRMVEEMELLTRTDNFALWFTGETLFEHQDEWYIKVNSFYDEHRAFNKNYTKWIDALKCEMLKIDSKADKCRFEEPVFYEVKRTSIDEFASRGDVIDNRDIQDKSIIDKLIKGEKDDDLFKNHSRGMIH